MESFDQFLLAIKNGAVQKVHNLSREIDINRKFSHTFQGIEHQDVTPVILASYYGNRSIISKIIEKRCDLGWNGLHFAAKCGHCICVGILLNKGVAVDSLTRKGETPLMLAMISSMKMTINSLLQYGADISLVPERIIEKCLSQGLISTELSTEISKFIPSTDNSTNEKDEKMHPSIIRLQAIRQQIFSELHSIFEISSKSSIELFKAFSSYGASNIQRVNAGQEILMILIQKHSTPSVSHLDVYFNLIESLLDEECLSQDLYQISLRIYSELHSLHPKSKSIDDQAYHLFLSANRLILNRKIGESNLLKFLLDILSQSEMNFEKVSAEQMQKFLESLLNLSKSLDLRFTKIFILIVEKIAKKLLSNCKTSSGLVFQSKWPTIYNLVDINGRLPLISHAFYTKILNSDMNRWWFCSQKSLQDYLKLLKSNITKLITGKEEMSCLNFNLQCATQIHAQISNIDKFFPVESDSSNLKLKEIANSIIRKIDRLRPNDFHPDQPVSKVPLFRKTNSQLLHSLIKILKIDESTSELLSSMLSNTTEFDRFDSSVFEDILALNLKNNTNTFDKNLILGKYFENSIAFINSPQEIDSFTTTILCLYNNEKEIRRHILSLILFHLKKSHDQIHSGLFMTFLMILKMAAKEKMINSSELPKSFLHKSFFKYPRNTRILYTSLIFELGDHQIIESHIISILLSREFYALGEYIFIMDKIKGLQPFPNDTNLPLHLIMFLWHLTKTGTLLRDGGGSLVERLLDLITSLDSVHISLESWKYLVKCRPILVNYPDDSVRKLAMKLSSFLDLKAPSADCYHLKRVKPVSPLRYFYSMHEFRKTTALMTASKSQKNVEEEMEAFANYSSFPGISSMSVGCLLILRATSSSHKMQTILNFSENPRDFIRRNLYLILPFPADSTAFSLGDYVNYGCVEGLVFWFIFGYLNHYKFTVPFGSLIKFFMQFETIMRAFLFIPPVSAPVTSLLAQTSFFALSRPGQLFQIRLADYCLRNFELCIAKFDDSFTLEVNRPVSVTKTIFPQSIVPIIERMNRFRRIAILINSMLPAVQNYSPMSASIVWHAVNLYHDLSEIIKNREQPTAIFYDELKTYLEVDEFIITLAECLYHLGTRNDLLSFIQHVSRHYSGDYEYLKVYERLLCGQMDQVMDLLEKGRLSVTNKKLLDALNKVGNLIEFHSGNLASIDGKSVNSAKVACIMQLSSWSQNLTCECAPEKNMDNYLLYRWRRNVYTSQLHADYHMSLVSSDDEPPTRISEGVLNSLLEVYPSQIFDQDLDINKTNDNMIIKLPVVGLSCQDFIDQNLRQPPGKINVFLDSENVIQTMNKYSTSPKFLSNLLTTSDIVDKCIPIKEYLQVSHHEGDPLDKRILVLSEFLVNQLRDHESSCQTDTIIDHCLTRLLESVKDPTTLTVNLNEYPAMMKLIKICQSSWFNKRPILISENANSVDEEERSSLINDQIIKSLFNLSLKFSENKCSSYWYSFGRWSYQRLITELDTMTPEKFNSSDTIKIMSEFLNIDHKLLANRLHEEYTSTQRPPLSGKETLFDFIHQKVYYTMNSEQLAEYLTTAKEEITEKVFGNVTWFTRNTQNCLVNYLCLLGPKENSLESRTACLTLLDLLTREATSPYLTDSCLLQVTDAAMTSWIMTSTEIFARLNSIQGACSQRIYHFLQPFIGQIIEQFDRDTFIKKHIVNHFLYPLCRMKEYNEAGQRIYKKMILRSSSSTPGTLPSVLFDINIFLRELSHLYLTKEQLIMRHFETVLNHLDNYLSFMKKLLKSDSTSQTLAHFVRVYVRQRLETSINFLDKMIRDAPITSPFDAAFHHWANDKLAVYLRENLQDFYQDISSSTNGESIELTLLYERLMKFRQEFYNLSWIETTHENHILKKTIDHFVSDYSHVLTKYNFDNLFLPGNDTDPLLAFSEINQKLSLISSHTKPKLISFMCQNGHSYSYLLKSFDQSIVDTSVMRLFEFSNLFYARKNSLYTMTPYKIIRMGTYSSLIRIVKGGTSLLSIYRKSFTKYLAKHHPEQSKDFSSIKIFFLFAKKHLANHLNVNAQTNRLIADFRSFRQQCPKKVLLAIHEDLKASTNPRLLINELWANAQSNAHWWSVYRRFTHTTASTSISGHMIGLCDRHLENVLVNLMTGDMIHIDLGIAYDMGRKMVVPDNVPFRLTNVIERCLSPFGNLVGFISLLSECLNANNANSDSLKILLETTLHEPINFNQKHDGCLAIEAYKCGKHLNEYQEYIGNKDDAQHRFFLPIAMELLSDGNVYQRIAELKYAHHKCSTDTTTTVSPKDLYATGHVRVLTNYVRHYLNNSKDFGTKGYSETCQLFLENNSTNVFLRNIDAVLDSIQMGEDVIMFDESPFEPSRAEKISADIANICSSLQYRLLNLNEHHSQLAPLTVDFNFDNDEIFSMKVQANRKTYANLIALTLFQDMFNLLNLQNEFNFSQHSRCNLVLLQYLQKFYSLSAPNKSDEELLDHSRHLYQTIEILYNLRERVHDELLPKLVDAALPKRANLVLLNHLKEVVTFNNNNQTAFEETCLEAIDADKCLVNILLEIHTSFLRVVNLLQANTGKRKLFKWSHPFFQQNYGVFNPVFQSILCLEYSLNDIIELNKPACDWSVELYQNGMLTIINSLLLLMDGERTLYDTQKIMTEDQLRQLDPDGSWININILDIFEAFLGLLTKKIGLVPRFILFLTLDWCEINCRFQMPTQAFINFNLFLSNMEMFSQELDFDYAKMANSQHEDFRTMAKYESLTAVILSNKCHLGYLERISEMLNKFYLTKIDQADNSPRYDDIYRMTEIIRKANDIDEILQQTGYNSNDHSNEKLSLDYNSGLSKVYEQLDDDGLFVLSTNQRFCRIHQPNYGIRDSLFTIIDSIKESKNNGLSLTRMIINHYFPEILIPVLHGVGSFLKDSQIIDNSLKNKIRKAYQNIMDIVKMPMPPFSYSRGLDVSQQEELRKIQETIREKLQFHDELAENLVQKASDPKTLCQMYEGWTPWV